ncbi:myeloid-derived growth factor-like [Saccostrea echinata]|uniref:myeloid-derived growth factor-like n=1 Tax=Saccostrea echinata TaxID=191078 RepID=UPI002A80F54A|nr:myeloid-derived growth factor-like [Saccostrea echinata]
MRQFLIILFTVATVSCFEMDEDEIQVATFDVKPGGELLSFEKEWDGVTCKFSYQAQGGTNEEWTMGMVRSDDHQEFSCSVERPQSYLFFQAFKMELTGIPAVEGEVYGPGMTHLKPEEFKFDKAANKISETGKFHSQLDKVVLYARRGKTEL